MGAFRYWGQWFITDYQNSGARNNAYKRLADATGLPIYVASVGPFSSNHERACELYAQIRGLQTDYGATRAAQTSVGVPGSSSRYAPAGTSMDFSTKTAWLPNWGLAGNNDQVHLIGHSMGAPTSRMLEFLMRFGKPDEAGTPGMSELFRTDLFATRKSAIRTITTIAGVNSGSTLHSKLATVQLGSGNLVDQVKNLLINIAGIDSSFTFDGTGLGSLYNFDLDRLGLAKGSGESFTSFQTRVFSSPTLAPTYTYLAHYDLAPGFMYDFNTRPGTNTAYLDTFYLAIATSRTSSCNCNWLGLNCQDQCPGTWMEAILKPTSQIMGRMDGVADAYRPSLTFNNDWEENDGLVSRISTRGPMWGTSARGTTGSASIPQKYDWCGIFCSMIDDFGSAYQSGTWYHADFSYDHLQAVGFQIVRSSPTSRQVTGNTPEATDARFHRRDGPAPSRTPSATSSWARLRRSSTPRSDLVALVRILPYFCMFVDRVIQALWDPTPSPASRPSCGAPPCPPRSTRTKRRRVRSPQAARGSPSWAARPSPAAPRSAGTLARASCRTWRRCAPRARL